MPNSTSNVDHKVQPKDDPQIVRFRRDHSNLILYYSASGEFLLNLLSSIDNAILTSFSTDGASKSFIHYCDSSNSLLDDIYNFIDTNMLELSVVSAHVLTRLSQNIQKKIILVGPGFRSVKRKICKF